MVSTSHHRPTAGRSLIGLLAAAMLATAMVMPAPGLAWADDEGTGDRAFDLVRQAIAILVNTPDDHPKVEHKIEQALEAKDTSGVQLPLVERAMQALESDDIHQARRLLEQSIGARVHTGPDDPVPIGEPPPLTGAETGTLAAVDELPGRHGLGGGDWVMLVISLAVGLAGILWAFRLRPHLPHPGSAR